MTAYTKHRFHALDGMRGVAAIVVMVYHYYLDSHLRCLKNPFLAVDFFFILSGFVISHAYGGKLLNGLGGPRRTARLLAHDRKQRPQGQRHHQLMARTLAYEPCSQCSGD